MSEIELPNPEELEEMKGKRFTKRVALATAIFAVVLAIASLGRSWGRSTVIAVICCSRRKPDLGAGDTGERLGTGPTFSCPAPVAVCYEVIRDTPIAC